MLSDERSVYCGKCEVTDTQLPGKVSKHKLCETVPQTDTGGHVEKTQAMRELR